jgi:hypothetical protein
MGDFTSSSVPGCRAPHVWLAGGRSLYDALGPDYSLLRFDPGADVSGLIAAAGQRGLPMRLVEVDDAEARKLYGRALVLVRPDQHVAWRGETAPGDPGGLVDLIRGGGPGRRAA